MSAKDRLLRARLPRGLSDRTAAEIRATERMLATIRSVYERYGFEPVETPLIEYTDALGKFLPDQDRPNEGVFSFQDDDEQWLSLRYDLTAPLARYVAENFDRLPKPYRSYRAGWVFRNEKPGPGRFRQFMQFDADTVGAASPAADAEICMMAADTLEALGIPRGQYVIKVNSRKVLEGLRESLSVGGSIPDTQWLGVLRAADKLDRLGANAVFQLATTGRTDESGDFAPGAGLTIPQADNVMRFLGFTRDVSTGMPVYRHDALQRPDIRKNSDAIRWLEDRVELGPTGRAGLEDLRQIASLCGTSGYDESRVFIDPSVVRGLEYYTGAVYEADLSFEVKDEDGRPVRFGSIGGGGRYDGLVGRFMKQDVPATGFSVGVSRLQAALAALGKGGAREADGPVVVLVMDRGRFGDYQAMVSRLRDAGVAAELYLGDSGMRAQMKYADRRNAPLAIIQGEDEKARGVVQVKDLVEGKRLAGAIGDHAAYREERPGQFEVAEAELVEAVKRALAGASHSHEHVLAPNPQAAMHGRALRNARPSGLELRGTYNATPLFGRTLALRDCAMTDSFPSLRALFTEAGYSFVEPPILYDARVFVELAGEDLRRRLFLANAADGTELALRPDYTIPIALHHLASGAAKRRADYAYLGPVFRQRPNEQGEFLQAGVESLGRNDRAAADADMLRLALRASEALGIREPMVRIGDSSLFGAVLAALDLAEPWRRRLSRSFGNTPRLQTLIGRLSGGGERPPAQAGFLAALDGADHDAAHHVVEDLLALAGIKTVGGRTAGEIAERFLEKAALAAGAAANTRAPEALRRFLTIGGSPEASLKALRTLARAEKLDIGKAVDLFERRAEGFAGHGIDVSRLTFAADFGRRLDYYTGFVFEIHDAARAGLAQIVGGGRYDKLIALLGPGGAVPAIGFSIWLDRIGSLSA